MYDAILITGLKGAGKDTAGKFFTDRGYVKVSFADKLKDVIAITFGWERQLLEGDTDYSRQFRETSDDWWAKKLDRDTFTPRDALVEIGTDVFRQHFHDNIWVSALLRSLKTTQRYVFTDVRYINEITLIQDYFGENNVSTIRIRRSPEPVWVQELRKGNIEKPNGVHLSEYALVRYDTDCTIVNNQSISDLHRKISLEYTDV
jgi:hypothetical protein